MLFRSCRPVNLVWRGCCCRICVKRLITWDKAMGRRFATDSLHRTLNHFSPVGLPFASRRHAIRHDAWPKRPAALALVSRRRVVLTGGPGAGKTAVLELIRLFFCVHVRTLPEAAGIVFGGGFPRSDRQVLRQAAQRAIYHVQRELEVKIGRAHV